MIKQKTLSFYLTIFFVGLFSVTSILGQADQGTAHKGTYSGDCVRAANSQLSEFAPAALAASLLAGQQFTNVDHRSFGVGGMDAGTGSLTVGGVSGSVTKAFLYWNYLDITSASPTPNGNVVFNGTAVTGASVGASGTNCWGSSGATFTMLADVTTLVSGNGNYTLAGFPGPYAATNRGTNGVSLIIIYDDGNNANNRDLYIFHGNDSTHPQGFPGDTDGVSSTLNGIMWDGTGTPTIELHVADGQSGDDRGLFFNATQIVGAGGTLWDGTSVPSGGSTRSTGSNLWDVKTFNLGPPYFVSGNNNLTVSSPAGNGDCYALAVAVVSVPAVTPPYDFSWFSYSGLLLNEQALNQMTAGSTVPIRFTLYGNKGNPYSSPPTSQQINCATGVPMGAVTVINRSLPDPSYSAMFDFYQTTWHTQASWKFTCRRLTLYLNDGTTRSLDFYFK